MSVVEKNIMDLSAQARVFSDLEMDVIAAICSLGSAPLTENLVPMNPVHAFHTSLNSPPTLPENKKMRTTYKAVKAKVSFLMKPPRHYYQMGNNDERCKIPKILVDAISSGDKERLSETIRSLCTEDCILINEYDGDHHPYGPNRREVHGIDNIIDYYNVTFASAPDSLATFIRLAQGKYDPEINEAFITFELSIKQTKLSFVMETFVVDDNITTTSTTTAATATTVNSNNSSGGGHVSTATAQGTEEKRLQNVVVIPSIINMNKLDNNSNNSNSNNNNSNNNNVVSVSSNNNNSTGNVNVVGDNSSDSNSDSDTSTNHQSNNKTNNTSNNTSNNTNSNNNSNNNTAVSITPKFTHLPSKLSVPTRAVIKPKKVEYSLKPIESTIVTSYHTAKYYMTLNSQGKITQLCSLFKINFNDK